MSISHCVYRLPWFLRFVVCLPLPQEVNVQVFILVFAKTLCRGILNPQIYFVSSKSSNKSLWVIKLLKQWYFSISSILGYSYLCSSMVVSKLQWLAISYVKTHILPGFLFYNILVSLNLFHSITFYNCFKVATFQYFNVTLFSLFNIRIEL